MGREAQNLVFKIDPVRKFGQARRSAKLTNNCARGSLQKQTHFRPSVVFAEKYAFFRGRQATAGWSSKANLTEVLAQNDKWLIQMAKSLITNLFYKRSIEGKGSLITCNQKATYYCKKETIRQKQIQNNFASEYIT